MADIHRYIHIPEGYTLSFEDDVYVLMEEEFKQRSSAFLRDYQDIQQKEQYPFLPEQLIKKFPFVSHPPFKDEIFTRRQDVALLETLLRPYFKGGKSVLEIGGWNGWLTKLLCAKEMNVLSVDLFADSRNGLRTRQHHEPHNWLSLQTDICDTKVFRENFDVVIFNHCLHFYPEQTLQHYYSLLNPGGILVILGVSDYSNQAAQQRKVLNRKEYYRKKYGFSLYFYDGPGYYSKAFIGQLHADSYKFISYRFTLKSRIVKALRAEKHGIFYKVKP